MSMLGKKAQLLALFNLDSHIGGSKGVDIPENIQEESTSGRMRTDILQMMLRMPSRRIDRYKMLRDLDEGLAASVIDLYAEETTQSIRDSDNGEQILVKSKNNKNIETEGNKVLRRLGLAHGAYPLIRNILLYGDLFYRVYIKPTGIQRAFIIDKPESVSRQEDEQKRLTGFKQYGMEFIGTHDKYVSNAWDFVHFANLSRADLFPYGASILHNSFRTLRQVILTEDGVLLYRLCRHPDRLMHIIDTGTADTLDQHRILNQWINNYKRTQHINPSGSSYDYRNSQITPTEDLFIATAKDSQTRIDKLEGASNAFDVHDLDYWMNKFFSEVRVPKGFMGFEGDINKAATLTSQSIRFARAVAANQQVYKAGIRLLLQIHFNVISKTTEDPTYDWTLEGGDFDLEMAYTSGLAESDWINLLVQRVESANLLMPYLSDPYVDRHAMLYYMFTKILQFREDDVNKILRDKPVFLPPNTESMDLPAMHKLRELQRKDATPEEKRVAQELVNRTPMEDFVKEIAWYLDETLKIHNANKTVLTPYDKGEMSKEKITVK